MDKNQPTGQDEGGQGQGGQEQQEDEQAVYQDISKGERGSEEQQPTSEDQGDKS